MTLDNTHDLFEHKLMAVFAAEKRNLDMLDEAASEVKAPKLREAFERHREETREQVRRVERVFESLQRRPRVVDAPVVEGLFEEKRRFLQEDPTPEVMDLFHLSAALKAEHIEIASYEDLLTLADSMGARDLEEPLRANLDEERAALDRLMRLSQDGSIQTPRRSADAEMRA